MLVDFNEVKEVTIPGMNNGTGEMSARMYMDKQGKIIPTVIPIDNGTGLGHEIHGRNRRLQAQQTYCECVNSRHRPSREVCNNTVLNLCKDRIL